MNAKDTLSKIKTALGMEVSLEAMKLENGTVLEAEKFEAGEEVFIVNEDERIALPAGDYTLEDGRILKVEEEGIIASIEAEEEEPTEAPAEEEEAPAEEVKATEEVTKPKKVVKSITEEMFFAEIEKLRNEIKGLKLSKTEETPVSEIELSEVNEIVHSPEANVEKKEINLYSQKRGGSTLDRVFAKLNN